MGAVQVGLTFVVLTNRVSIPGANGVPEGLLLLGMIFGLVWGFAGVLLFVSARPAIWTGLCVGGLLNILYFGLEVINVVGNFASSGRPGMELFWACGMRNFGNHFRKSSGAQRGERSLIVG